MQGTLGLCLKSAGLIRVILRSEPVFRVGVHKKWGGDDGDWDERDVKVREQVHIIYLCCNFGHV